MGQTNLVKTICPIFVEHAHTKLI